MTDVKIFGLFNTAHFRCKLKRKCKRITLEKSIFKKSPHITEKIKSCYFSSCTPIWATLSLLLMKPEERWPRFPLTFFFFTVLWAGFYPSTQRQPCLQKGSRIPPAGHWAQLQSLCLPAPALSERESEIKQQVSSKNCFPSLRIDKLMVPLE